MCPDLSAAIALTAACYEQSVVQFWLGRLRLPPQIETAIVAQLCQLAAEPRLAGRQRLWLQIALEGLARRLGPAGMKLAAINVIAVGVLPLTILARGREQLN
jgi:hypothetical protein